MKQSLVELEKLKKEMLIRKRNYDYNLRGKTGFCFIRGKIIIKLYEYPKDEKNMCDLSIFKSKRISFPIDYIYEKGKIIGEILPFYNADTLNNSFNIRNNIDMLTKSFNEIIDEIDKFDNIAMYDMWAENILYSSKYGMFLIDTTDWKIRNNCFFDNLELLERSIALLFKNLIYDGNMYFDIEKDYLILRKSGLGRELLNIIYNYIFRISRSI